MPGPVSRSYNAGGWVTFKLKIEDSPQIIAVQRHALRGLLFPLLSPLFPPQAPSGARAAPEGVGALLGADTDGPGAWLWQPSRCLAEGWLSASLHPSLSRADSTCAVTSRKLSLIALCSELGSLLQRLAPSLSPSSPLWRNPEPYHRNAVTDITGWLPTLGPQLHTLAGRTGFALSSLPQEGTTVSA